MSLYVAKVKSIRNLFNVDGLKDSKTHCILILDIFVCVFCRKAVRATLILFPLLGVTYVLFITSPSDNPISRRMFVYFNAVLQSFQVGQLWHVQESLNVFFNYFLPQIIINNILCYKMFYMYLKIFKTSLYFAICRKVQMYFSKIFCPKISNYALNLSYAYENR